MEFMRFNPLRNPREAALFSSPSPSLLPDATVYGGLRGLRMIPARRLGEGGGGGGGGDCTPETAGSKVQEEESSPTRFVLPHRERASFNAGQ